MKKFLNFFNVFKVKSLYIKWLIIFTGFIIITQIITFAITTTFLMQDLEKNISNRLYQKASSIKYFYNEGYVITEGTLEQVAMNMDIMFNFISEDNEDLDKYKSMITLDMLQNALNGEIILWQVNNGNIPLIFCLVAIGDEVALIRPNLINNEFLAFTEVMRNSVIIGAVIGAMFIVVALKIVITPIKKVTAATKE